jgi:hypothetical protein
VSDLESVDRGAVRIDYGDANIVFDFFHCSSCARLSRWHFGLASKDFHLAACTRWLLDQRPPGQSRRSPHLLSQSQGILAGQHQVDALLPQVSLAWRDLSTVWFLLLYALFIDSIHKCKRAFKLQFPGLTPARDRLP